MKSFNNDQKLKEDLLTEIIKHRESDAIVQRTYGEGDGKNWKGCAVGCAIHSLNIIKGSKWKTSNHSIYEHELGIPRVLARLEDRIFEGLSVEESKTFPEKFISAISVGVELNNVWPKFVVWLLGDETYGVKKFAKNKSSIKAIQDVLDLYTRKVAGENITTAEWIEGRNNAYAADAYASYAAAAYAADAYAADAYASYAAAAYAADAYASYASAYAAAAYASYASAYAAAAYASYASAYAADADAQAHRQKYYTLMAAKLIEIISNEK